MIELPLVLVAGLLGSSHCIGMCGPFALTIGHSAPSLRHNLLRQSLYTLGRVFTYAVLGAAVGFGGWRIANAFPALVNVPAVLAIAAGLLLIWQGLLSAGVVKLRRIKFGSGPCLAGSFFANLLTGRHWVDVFLAGLFTGLLPCGLLYAMLALAASSTNMLLATATMVVFGLGTMPVMVATGLSGSLLGIAARRKLYTVAAWCVVLTGVISVGRGIFFLELPWFSGGGCPMCHP
jgi:sulfite exporter TauE/SafE